MIKYFFQLTLFLLLFLGFKHCYSQNIPLKNKTQNFFEETEKKSKKGVFLLSAGCNISSYLFEDGEWQLGFRLGFTFNIRASKKVSITLPCSYTRINATPKNVEGASYSSYFDNRYIYRNYTDWQISVGFLEIPILLSYKFYNTRRYNVRFTIGPGIAIAIKDFSRIENVTITDEIIGTYDVEPIDSYEYHFTYSNSGFNLNTGIRFNISRFYLDLMYIFYPYTIKDINNLNTISLIFSIDLE